MISMSIENHVKSLNKWDVYPGISTFYSGPLRIIAGAIQIVAGAILTIVSALFGWMNGSSVWEKDMAINAEEVIHGIGNLTRGSIALIPCLGNLLIYIYDKTPKSIDDNSPRDTNVFKRNSHAPLFGGWYLRNRQPSIGDALFSTFSLINCFQNHWETRSHVPSPISSKRLTPSIASQQR